MTAQVTWLHKKVISGVPERTSPRTPLECDRAFTAGRASFRADEFSNPWRPGDACHAYWLAGSRFQEEETAREDAERARADRVRRAPLLALMEDE